VIDADPQRITQAMLNLARNAVDHTVPGAEIGLGSAWEDGAVRLWVRDTGTGIDSVEREHIFERFARVRSGRRSDGAGLGLPIVRSVALAHGGWVELDSSLGQGSTFTIVLPAAPGAARPPGAGPSEDTAETTSPRGSQDGPNPDRRG
jgi:signal transduction histidine kinase